MTVDAVIVGSGPGGATVADVLTAAGWSVTIVEKGRNHLLDPDDLSRPAFDYSNDEIKFLSRHFLGPDPLTEPRTFRTGEDDGDRLHVGEVNSVPTTVGGGGTHADGKVPRFRPEDFRVHSVLGPQPDAEVADWPLDYDELEPYYAEVERAIGVAGTEGANPFAAPRSGPFPMPSGPPMFGATRSVAAAERLGYHPYAAPTAANSVPYDGRPACNNCGFCAYFGCPIHAKGDPIAMLQRTMATGRAELLSETFVTRVRFDGRRATGVDVIGPDGAARFLPARHVVIAAGAIETPRLLLLSERGPRPGGPVPDDPLPDHHGRLHALPDLRRAGPGRDPRARRHDRGGRRLPGRGDRGRAAVDPGRPGRARRGRTAHHGGQAPPVGRPAPRTDGRLAHPGPPVGLHHAGRGPPLSGEPGGSRSHHQGCRGVCPWPGSPTARAVTNWWRRPTTAPGWSRS